MKKVRVIAKYLLQEKASVPKVLAKANELKKLAGDPFWMAPSVPELEQLREAVRDLMQFLDGQGKGKYEIDITDHITESDYTPEDTVIDIRTYREKVLDYLAENSDSEVIRKIRNLEPISYEDLQQLEQILWHDLGTRNEYEETTEIDNLAVFVRSLVGLSQEAVNEKFGEYLSGNRLNARQQEFVKTVIDYVRVNGDIKVEDLVNTEPFNSYDIQKVFGIDVPALVSIINLLHNSVVATAGVRKVDRRPRMFEIIEDGSPYPMAAEPDMDLN